MKIPLFIFTKYPIKINKQTKTKDSLRRWNVINTTNNYYFG